MERSLEQLARLATVRDRRTEPEQRTITISDDDLAELLRMIPNGPLS